MPGTSATALDGTGGRSAERRLKQRISAFGTSLYGSKYMTRSVSRRPDQKVNVATLAQCRTTISGGLQSPQGASMACDALLLCEVGSAKPAPVNPVTLVSRPPELYASDNH